MSTSPESTRANRHQCHAFDCETLTHPRMFMCVKHWRMVPKAMKDAVWAAYTPGQERNGFPSEEAADRYMAATRAARVHVRDLERSNFTSTDQANG